MSGIQLGLEHSGCSYSGRLLVCGVGAHAHFCLQLFGEGRLRSGDLRVTSTKGALGHLLGAAGAVEAAVTVLATHSRQIPPTANLTQPDNPTLLGLTMSGGELASKAACLCNSFGFGGVNASLLITSLHGAVSWANYS
jgi:3-oxoacyl-[acyl-carrier-protein] synthase II